MALLATERVPILLFLSLLILPLAIALLRRIRGETIELTSYDYIPLTDVHESLVPLVLAAAIAYRDGGWMILVLVLVIVIFAHRHVERLLRPFFRWEKNYA